MTSQTSAARTTNFPPPGPAGLTTGAKAGVGTGCSIAGLLHIFGTLYLFIRRRRRLFSKKRASTGTAFEKPELEGKGAQKHMEEKDGGEVLEMEGECNEAPRRELHGSHMERQPVEMGDD